jgi:hypothetical protein
VKHTKGFPNTGYRCVYADGWIRTAKMAFSWLLVLSVSRASLGSSGRRYPDTPFKEAGERQELWQSTSRMPSVGQFLANKNSL